MRQISKHVDMFVPESSKVRSAPSLLAARKTFTDGNAGKIWFLENDNVSNNNKEKYFPRVDEDGNPIYVTKWIAREWATREYVRNQRKLKESGSVWLSSLSYRSYKNSEVLNLINSILEKEGKKIVTKQVNNGSTLSAGSSEPLSTVCLAGGALKHLDLDGIAYKIPSCINNEWYPSIESFKINEAPIKTVTGMNNMKVKTLSIPETVERIDPNGLPKGLEHVVIHDSTKFRNLTGLENTGTISVEVSRSNIETIDPDGVPKTLKQFFTNATKLKRVGGLQNTNLNTLSIQKEDELSSIDPLGLPQSLKILKIKMTSLKEVPDLDGTKITQMDFDNNSDLHSIGKLPNSLEYLSIGTTAITDLGNLSNTSLTTIVADDSKISSIDANKLPRTLKTIYLRQTPFAKDKKKCTHLQSSTNHLLVIC